MKSLLLCFCLIISLCSCDRNEPCEDIPSCISRLIREQNPPLEIWRYTYNGELVYLTRADCCDQYDQLYLSDCTLLCASSGGITGKGDGKCPDFYDQASNPQLVWKAE